MSAKRKSVLDHLGESRQGFLETTLKVGTALGQLHPIGQAVLACVNIVYDKLKDEQQCNELVLKLAQDMACSIGYIQDVEQFATLPQLQQAIKDIRPLFEKARDFIVDFYSHTTALNSIVSSSTSKEVIELTEKFSRFKDQFDRGIAVQSASTLVAMESLLASAKDDELLKELKLPGLERGSPISGCMEGTRGDILARIDEWVQDLSAPNILWLKGFPGAGKSAIASSLVERLRDSHRLGSSFFFERAKSNTTTVTALWRTVAFDLARLYPTARKLITANWEKVAVGAANTVDADKLFRLLIKDSLESTKDVPNGRLPVVVIDALDECGGLEGESSDEREMLLETIKSWLNLPPKFKLVVTSRGEADITQALSLRSRCIELPSGNSVDAQTSNDIKIFLKKLLYATAEEYPDIRPFKWLDVIDELSTQAAGLFIWARTVAKFVGSAYPAEQLKRIQRNGMKAGNMAGLYQLILDISFKESGEDSLQAFREIVGAIVVAKSPLSRSDCMNLLSVNPGMLKFICNRLQSVMDTGDVLRFSHQSFADFLISDENASAFRIDRAKHDRTLAVNCLRVMKTGLRFNICNMVTSYVRNDESPNSDEIAKNPIPTHLSYSCLFWGGHLRSTPFETETLDQVKEFMDERFLYWLEVLSLIRGVHTAAQTLSSVIEWCRANDNDIVTFVKDGIKFLAAFGRAISQSAPHIYLSALPFAPSESKISKQFLHRFRGMLSLYTGKTTHWPAIQCVFEGHTDWVTSVAFSQDGRCIVSGSDDTTIRVWDVETGVSQPFAGHTSSVTSVAFSQDGRRIVSGSIDKTIRVWDVETGVSQIFQGHTGSVTSVAFSRDGKHIVSGSDDITIQVWDVTGVSKTFQGHTESVTSVAFSQDDRCIVSGSKDETIRVWDVETGLSQTFQGHDSWVTSVAFSHDGKHIVSGSFDMTIRVWDAETGVPQSFQGHTEPVTSVAFSHGGKHIVSGSFDMTIRVWDAETGISQPFQGHTGWVTSAAFSQDGKRIVSGSSDRTIRLWDAETNGVISRRQNEWHTDKVNSVAFSQDGKRIVSGSMDHTIRVWDMFTGSAVPVAFKGPTASVNSVAFSQGMVSGSWGNMFQVWDVETGGTVSGPVTVGSTVDSIAISQDGKHVASSSNRTIRVWNAETGELVSGPFEGHTESVTSVVFSQDGKRVVSGSEDKTILVWDVATGNAVAGPYRRHTSYVQSVAFSQDGRHIVSGSFDDTIRIWHLKTGNFISAPLKKRNVSKPLWDAETPDVISRSFEGHTDWVYSVAISQDGKRIVSGSSDWTVRVWDAETGDVVAGPFKGHTNRVNSVAISQDGKRIVSGSTDKTIRVWNADTNDVISEVSAMGLLRGTKIPPTSDSSKLVDDFDVVDGWLVRSDSAKLFWIPPWNRIGFWLPRTTAIISEDSARIDYSHFVHGTSWHQCKTWED
ncbi:tricorn protease domain 2-containing protein [Rickenella mellea]|uniref:Tricorn protease domain 2-containing protein n=1 Tax=Rickenella mellea TaxID=50990 RepID=A0A4Y7PVW0_9AGAM|nr:tricorn protease domain 2-containing protein [Rickenella mellea]